MSLFGHTYNFLELYFPILTPASCSKQLLVEVREIWIDLCWENAFLRNRSKRLLQLHF